MRTRAALSAAGWLALGIVVALMLANAPVLLLVGIGLLIAAGQAR